jgi:hypothetical protein
MLLQEPTKIKNSITLRTVLHPALQGPIVGQKMDARIAQVVQLLKVDPITPVLFKIVRLAPHHDLAQFLGVLIHGIQPVRKASGLLDTYRMA